MVLLSLPLAEKGAPPFVRYLSISSIHHSPSFSLPLLCFHAVTNCKFSNSFLLTFMQIGGGCTPRPILLFTTPLSPHLPALLFSISAHFARFWCHLSPFRINTSKSVSKQRTLSIFRINTYEKQGDGGPVIVNQTLDEECLSRVRRSGGSEGPLFISDEETCPAEHRHEGSQAIEDSGPARKGRSLTFQPSNLPTCKRPLFRPVHGDPAQQLGIEVGRFLRHHFAGRRDFHHLLDVAGIQQKRNLRAPAVHGIERRRRFPFVRQVRLGRHRLRRDSQRRLQDSFVQQHHVQFALQRRNIRQQLRQVDAFAQRQHVECPL